MTGKSRPQGLPVRGLVEAGPGRAHAAADHVRADHEVAVGVDRPPGPDHGLPPARLLRDRMDVGDMLVAGQRVADQDGVGALGVERAVGLVGDLERREVDAGIELQRLVRAEAHDQRMRIVRLARAVGGIKCDAGSTSTIFTTRLGAAECAVIHATGRSWVAATGLDRPTGAAVNVFFDFASIAKHHAADQCPRHRRTAMANAHSPCQIVPFQARRSPICGARSTASTRRCTAC